DGEQTRDFIHVKDIIAALVHSADHPELHGTFNAGYGTSMTINDLAAQIIRLSDSPSRIVHLPERLGDVRHSRASIGKLLATGFRHVSSLEQGIAETLGFFRNR
ncbi:MAG: NAD-dependent epimerase/dehydratase family protein, partial [Verrucomicrobiaceae bacterium]